MIEMAEHKNIRAAVLGGPGMVGRTFATILAEHPMLSLELIVGKSSAGKDYQSVHEKKEARLAEAYPDVWQPRPCPKGLDGLMVEAYADTDRLVSEMKDRDIKVVFSALDNKRWAWEIEKSSAEAGLYVFSNCGQHRLDPDIPLIVAEVNPETSSLIFQQEHYRRSGGFIIKNANCSTIGLAPVLAAIRKGYERDTGKPLTADVNVSTIQSLSGRGDTAYPLKDIRGNPYSEIGGEEPKMTRESAKILGDQRTPVYAICTRGYHAIGHLELMTIRLPQAVTRNQVEAWFTGYENPVEGLGLPTSPNRLFQMTYSPTDIRQESAFEHGMGMTIRQIKIDSASNQGNFEPGQDETALYSRGDILKISTVSNNLVRGAAGASVQNFEYVLRCHHELFR